MRRETGIGLRCLAGNPDVRLLGARVIRFGGSRIGSPSPGGEHRATLLVAVTFGGAIGADGPVACKGGTRSWPLPAQSQPAGIGLSAVPYGL
jgi:hypothetical protein